MGRKKNQTEIGHQNPTSCLTNFGTKDSFINNVYNQIHDDQEKTIPQGLRSQMDKRLELAAFGRTESKGFRKSSFSQHKTSALQRDSDHQRRNLACKEAVAATYLEVPKQEQRRISVSSASSISSFNKDEEKDFETESIKSISTSASSYKGRRYTVNP